MSHMVIRDVLDRRAAQDKQWGGAEHDDEHDILDWLSFIGKQGRKIMETYGLQEVHERYARDRFIDIAALAIAAAESLDRKA